MRHFLGLDVAKDSFVAALVTEAGELVAPPATFSNNAEGFAALLAWLRSRPVRSACANRPGSITSI